MTYFATITEEQLVKELQRELTNETAEMEALKAVEVNTTHKVLSNRSLTGAHLTKAEFSSMGAGHKQLIVPYQIIRADKYTTTTTMSLDPMIATGEIVGYLKQYRLRTPQEVVELVQQVIEIRAANIKKVKADIRKAASIVKKHNELVAKIEAYNGSLSYAARSARI